MGTVNFSGETGQNRVFLLVPSVSVAKCYLYSYNRMLCNYIP